MDETTVLRQMYALFNARDMEPLLAMMAPDVMWANAFEGGHEQGREAVRAYWTRQWAAFNPNVDPVKVTRTGDGTYLAEVHQVVKDLEGNLLFDGMVEHVFRIENGFVHRFDVSETLAHS